MGNSDRLARAAGLLFIGSLLGAMVMSRRLEMYLEPALALNEALAAISLVLLGFFQCAPVLVPGRGHRTGPGILCAHDTRKDDGWLSLVIFAIPGIIALGIPAATLDARVAVERGFGSEEGQQGPVSFEGALSMLQGGRETSGAGAKVDLVGFVVHTGDTPPECFLVARFVVTCCVADAMPLGMLVHWPAGPQPPQNSWVHVLGTLEHRPVRGVPMPVIVGRTVELVPKPRQPYLYR